MTYRTLKSHYRSGRDDLSADFFAPCLKDSVLYRRAAGYFSTSSLLSWAEALPRLAVEDGLRVRLIASPELSAQDVETLRNLEDQAAARRQREILVEQMLQEISELLDDPSDGARRARVFAWLIANDRLELRFAFPNHIENAGLFHEKIGVFDFPDGDQVAFTGSANETLGGHRRNYESLDVYRSWLGEENSRVQTKIEQFDDAWNNRAEGLSVLPPSQTVLQRLRTRAPKALPSAPPSSPPNVASDPRWRHQDEALNAFVRARHGVLEMATGSGKTRTALKIVSHLIADDQIDAAVITMEGTDLLDQWSAELMEWVLEGGPRWLIYRHYERHRQLGEFALDPHRGLIVISRNQLRRLLDRLPDRAKSRMIIIHDEVHGLGAPKLVSELDGLHGGFAFTLGLSATPDRAYDEEGNAFISREIGPVLFRFPLEAAISRGVLSEFDYVPLPYELTPGDRERLKSVYSRQAARAASGNPMSPEEVWTEISRVYKTAEAKPDIFRSYIERHPETLERAILFVETRDYGEPILEMVHRHTHLYRTYYADDDRRHLIAFAQGEIDTLITCHRISQGIDIQSLNTVVLFASARARLETIQRIGRCLRADPSRPDKRALVVDFVRGESLGDSGPNADQERAIWLTALSQVRKGDDHGA